MEEIVNVWNTIKSALEFELINIGGHSISIYNILVVVLILISFKILAKTVERLIKRKIADQSWKSSGKEHAITQITKYLLYVIGFIISLEAIGLNTTTILISSSALFVGLGFGLQEVFRDFISGIVLLFEGDVLIGDVIEMDNGIVGVVKKVNLRTSKLRTRDGIIMIVPNSQLINDRVINWSNSNKLTRFHVSVGVAYGSDVRLVEKLLVSATDGMEEISTRMKPFARFIDFGSSSLDFELHFWTEEVWQIENTKSQLRFNIDAKFRENNINIPFPQRDLHIKSSQISFSSSKE